MIDRLQLLVECVARASWQASILAAIVAVIAWALGNRLSARWRHALWSLVLIRFLVLVVPASPWSMFQVAAWPQWSDRVEMADAAMPAAGPTSNHDLPPEPAATAPSKAIANEPNAPTPVGAEPVRLAEPIAPVATAAASPALPSENTSSGDSVSLVGSLSLSPGQWLAILWLIGFALACGHLLWACRALRRMIAHCQRAEDEAILSLLEAVRRDLGLRRPVQLLITPNPISPCVAGVWNPRVLLPEFAATELPREALRQIFYHELAHVARGDLWTNWLLLAARAVHWFNPVAWWTLREMQSLREMACDERTVATLGGNERRSYAQTILELVGLVSSSPLTPGLVALFSSRSRLSRRIEHIARHPLSPGRGRWLAPVMLVLLGLVGLTDAGVVVAEPPSKEQLPVASAAAQAPPGEAAAPDANAETFTLSGRTITLVEDGSPNSRYRQKPVGGVDVALYGVRGVVGHPEKVAETKSDAEGHFSFADLEVLGPQDAWDSLTYGLVLRPADSPPVIVSCYPSELARMQLDVFRNPARLAGTVVDEQGQPVAGVTVFQYGIHRKPVPGLQSAVTDENGRFEINDLGTLKRHDASNGYWFHLAHPDYPTTSVTVKQLTPDVKHTIASGALLKPGANITPNVRLTIESGCVLTGIVQDEATGKPVAGATVLAQNDEEVPDDTATITGADGRYRLVVKEGKYNVVAITEDRVTKRAITGQLARSGQPAELVPLELTTGGWIEGRVFNTKTGAAVVDYREGRPTDQVRHDTSPAGPMTRLMVGVYGPADPPRRVIAQTPRVRVDAEGRFRMRVAAGDNYPFLANARGERMGWDTRKQPPVVVRSGETTAYDMRITPEPTNDEKMKKANAVLASLPKEMPQRAEAIIAEFRKLNHTVDECEIWCSLMRELVTIGQPAVPILVAELDATTEQRMMRRLGFALRAIGDPRAVPALIRALPKTLQPPMSDYGLLVADAELMKFMQQHDLDDKDRDRYFSFGRPVREVGGPSRR